jgi:hypothetical protein
MLTAKKILFFVMLFIGLSFLGTGALQSSGDSNRWKHISFATHKGSLKFFDHSSGKVYDYSERDGKLQEIWTLEELGKALKKVYEKQ